MAKELCHLGTAESLANQKDPVKAMVIAGFLGSGDLILNGQLHDLCFFDLQSAHNGLLLISMMTEDYIMRKYL
jgi:hypothetical protein